MAVVSKEFFSHVHLVAGVRPCFEIAPETAMWYQMER